MAEFGKNIMGKDGLHAMRIAILSDIHANLEALQAVVVDMGDRLIDRIICLGDNIGYGPDPEAVVRLVREIGCLCVLGNHEAALVSEKARRWMNFQAQENSFRTEQMLSEESRKYCQRLPTSLELDDAVFVHGFPPDSVFIYLNRQPDSRLAGQFASSPRSRFFVGHTHELQLVCQEGVGVVHLPLGEGTVGIPPDSKAIVNAGSVGQPRGHDKRAKYVIWDQAAHELEVRCVPYDGEATARKILELGFPGAYAERLYRS